MSFYHGQEPGHTLGVLSGPGPERHDYAWWEAGALWGTMVDYWKYTGDSTYNDIVQASLLSQTGPDRNYMEPNVTAFIGNDDQSFWGLSAMLAAESNFQNPPPADPQWLALAQAVFNTQTDPDRRDGSCGGGLRWQIFALNHGYSYKNAISNGLYFNLAARLARYTGDSSYARHAAETFDWMLRIGLVDGGSFDVFDGAHVEHDCRDINRAQFSYNAAVLLQGAAFMYDFTGGEAVWARRVDGLLGSMLRTFFVPPFGDGESDERIAFEPACEGGASNVPSDGCTGDMLAFKGFTARWMAATAQLCPWTRDSITPVLRSSAEAAVRQCIGGANGRMCGMHWSSGRYDGTVGVGQEMNVLSALMVLLGDEPADPNGGRGDWQGEVDNAVQPPRAPLTHDTGGTSEGDPNAGQSLQSSGVEFEPITDGDVRLAAVITSAVIVSMFIVFVFMCSETVRPHKGNYIELSDLPRRPGAESVFVNGPIDWVDLEERRPSRRASKVRIRTTNGRLPAGPAKSLVALPQRSRATDYREDGESAFGGDEASDVEDDRRTRIKQTRRGGKNLNKRVHRLHGRPAVARGRCQRRDFENSGRAWPS